MSKKSKAVANRVLGQLKARGDRMGFENAAKDAIRGKGNWKISDIEVHSDDAALISIEASSHGFDFNGSFGVDASGEVDPGSIGVWVWDEDNEDEYELVFRKVPAVRELVNKAGDIQIERFRAWAERTRNG